MKLPEVVPVTFTTRGTALVPVGGRPGKEGAARSTVGEI